MATNPTRPFADKTDGELFLMSERLEREIEELQAQNAAISAEVQSRGGSTPKMLEYRQSTTLNAKIGELGDLYADFSKSYALKMTLVLALAALVIAVLLVIAMVVLLAVA